MMPKSHLKRILLITVSALLLTSAVTAEGTDQVAAKPSNDFLAAENALQSKNYVAAIELYEQVLGSTSDESLRSSAKFRASEARFLSGDVTGASTGFHEYIQRQPKTSYTADAYNYLGEIALQSSDSEQAIALFGFALENASEGIPLTRARLGLARALLAAGRWEEVPIALGRLTHSADPDVAAEALLILGRVKYEAGQYDLALDSFRRIYELPMEPVTLCRGRLGAGWSLWKLARFEEIAAEIQPLVKTSACEIEYHYLLGMAEFSTKNWANAAAELKQAASAPSAHRPAALFYLAECLLQAERAGEAKSAFQLLIDSEPNSEWADDAAWGLARTARVAKSQIDLNEACEFLRTNFPTSEYVGLIPSLLASGDFTDIESTPGFALFEEAVGLERDGDFNAALAVYHAFLTEKNSDTLQAEGLWRTARLHERLKQRVEAAKCYEHLLADFPKFARQAEVFASLAWIAAESGKQAAAAKHCRDLVANFPQTSQAAEAAYWLGLAAADEKNGDDAQHYVDWLLAREDLAQHSPTKAQARLWEQTLCLQCQLFADESKWQSIAELLDKYDKPINKNASTARLEFWRAEAALRLGNHAEASKRFDALIAQTVGVFEPWVPMVALRRAQLAARREDWQAVLKLVSELDQRYPEFELAYECDYLRGRALAGRGEMSAARTAYGQVLENDWATGTETAALAQWMIGETYFHQQDYKHASIAYEKVIERHNLPEWQARAALQAGKCAELAENWAAAREQYSRALERWQGSTSEKQLAARLKWTEERVAQDQATLRR